MRELKKNTQESILYFSIIEKLVPIKKLNYKLD
jgi:hypothetical protein